MNREQLWKAWSDFWFRPATPEPVALFRILFGLLMLQVLLVHLGGDFLTWYGSSSIVSAQEVRDSFWIKEPRFDLFLLLGNNDQLITYYYYALVFFALCLTAGFMTRFSAAFIALSLISMHHHCPFNINGGDAFLRLTSLWLMFSNAGECYSVDAWIRRKKEPDWQPSAKPPWAQRMIQMQLALVYCQTFWLKLSGQQWVDGTAVYYATRLQDLGRFPLPLFDSLLFCKLLSWGTLVIELAMWTVVWIKEFRYYTLLGALLLHLGIDYAINLPVFEWAFIVALVTFVEPEDCRKAVDWIMKLPEMIVGLIASRPKTGGAGMPVDSSTTGDGTPDTG